MITAKLFGRLGNTMFQMGAAISYAKKHNMEYAFPKETDNPEKWKRYFPHLPTLDKTQEFFYYEEPSFNYTEIPYHKDILLDGYWQSYKYIDDAREEIIKAFGFDNIETYNACSLHYRAGDYKNFPGIHPIISDTYIKHAILYMYWKGYSKFIVFSDDIPEIRSKIESYGNNFHEGITFEYSTGNDELTDLKKMASCSSNIIANSSYSWFGAWLNPNPDKHIICPSESNWFGPDHKLDTSDLLPKDWERIKY